MIYTIVVKNEDNTETREYPINVVELRKKDGVYDSLYIDSYGNVTITRRIGYYQGETYILSEEVVENCPNIEIKLFEGINFIALKDDNNSYLSITYILKNEFTETYATKVEMHTIIQQSAENILIQAARVFFTKEDAEGKANKETLLSEINICPEGIAIQSNRIALEGYTTINGGFAVDENGNASIANGTVEINEEGIQLADGSSIIGGEGLYTNLYFPSLEWQNIGYSIVEPNMPDYEVINIGAYIPENFVIKSAYLILQLHPVRWSYDNLSQLGYPRNIKLYYEEISTGIVTPFEIPVAGEDYDDRYVSTNTESLNATGTSNQMIEFTSADLKNFLTPRKSNVVSIKNF